MLPGGASIRRSPDPATDGPTDEGIRHGSDNNCGKDLVFPPHFSRTSRLTPRATYDSLLESAEGGAGKRAQAR
jgi:hypothetical protein